MSGEVLGAALTQGILGARGGASGHRHTARWAWEHGGVNDSSRTSPRPGDAPDPALAALDALVETWLPLPDAAEVLGVDASRVRRLIDEGQLVAVRRGTPVLRSIPADLLVDGEIAPHLGGTITVLRDAGYTDVELLTWLFTEDETLPGRPIDHLRRGQRGEVRRRAQALAF